MSNLPTLNQYLGPGGNQFPKTVPGFRQFLNKILLNNINIQAIGISLMVLIIMDMDHGNKLNKEIGINLLKETGIKIQDMLNNNLNKETGIKIKDITIISKMKFII